PAVIRAAEACTRPARKGEPGDPTPENLDFWAYGTLAPRPDRWKALPSPVGGSEFGRWSRPRRRVRLKYPPAVIRAAEIRTRPAQRREPWHSAPENLD